MLRFFGFADGKLVEHKLGDKLLDYAISNTGWIDAQDTSDEERDRLEILLHTELPESDDVEEIESSARYFTDNSGIHVHSLFVTQSEGRMETTTVAFILQADRLITVREQELADFRLLRMRARRGQVEVRTPRHLLLTMFEQKVENLADTIEDLHLELEVISHKVLEETTTDLESAIDDLAALEDSNGKVRLCLMDTQRSIAFLQRQLRDTQAGQEIIPEIIRDIDTLMSHTTFLFDKINFLMGTTQGFINIEQNKIIKMFSIAAVVFLPPTLVASLYGMNFRVMPELDWVFGYPMAIGLMILAGVTPYWFFKRKGWM
ncbi:MAG: magnesium/cobalt transporter CorA [Candidatus Thiothrix sulfatifontis]|uniref:Magnesium transport protein CorA n=1 Tax=Thiothrix subterranea TaxID=2735563 RepID=A0AA51MRP8_9GAMM|nr:magnesium/cobalt transporter CorA [Thiothrix subterranea]MDQ5767434.1 magnesium/cobalt transporter CorA [Thiothrix subterranea]QQZ30006.1 magnesium/cobalt transporter CorA [Thiothrix subterranea]UOG91886.1 MAG: magnesium/cobalt transporter CorA [Candidatus Thiothrix sulfatifontis]WML88694.1 magnesium/cobalt transporter CorA [Thiothrix subterranea]